MQIKVNTQTILTTPADKPQNIPVTMHRQNAHNMTGRLGILPASLRKERFAWPSLNGPERNRKPNPIQSSPGDLRDILLRLSNVIM